MTEATRPLEPLDLGGLIATTFRLYRRNFVLFAGTAAMVTVLQLVDFVLTPLSLFVFIIFWPIIVGVLAKAIAIRYFDQKASIRDVYASIGWGAFLLLVAANLIIALGSVLGFMLLLIPGIFFLVLCQFVPHAIVLEHTSLWQAFRRSWKLVADSWWRVFGITLLLYAVAAILDVVALVVIVIPVVALKLQGEETVLLLILVMGLLWSLLDPIVFGIITLLYYDTKVRQEGFRAPVVQPAVSYS